MMNFEIRHYEEIDSTNTEARRLSQSEALLEKQHQSHSEVRDGLVVVAERQSAGRGRRGRSWESDEAGNLYFSVLLKPKIEPEKAPMLTLVMAYSVARAILRLYDQLGLHDVAQREVDTLQIKWPNDLVIGGKKVCGILTEMHLSEGGCQPNSSEIEDVIIGVGVNVNGSMFSEKLAGTATSLKLAIDGMHGEEFDKEALLRDILKEFEQQYDRFLKEQDLSFLQREYNAILANYNKEVRVLAPRQEYNGLALGINEKGELLVQREDNSVETVYAGEVSVRGIYGYV